MAGKPNKVKSKKWQISLCYHPVQAEKFSSMKSAGGHRNQTEVVYKAVQEYYKQLFGESLY